MCRQPGDISWVRCDRDVGFGERNQRACSVGMVVAGIVAAAGEFVGGQSGKESCGGSGADRCSRKRSGLGMGGQSLTGGPIRRVLRVDGERLRCKGESRLAPGIGAIGHLAEVCTGEVLDKSVD